MVIVRIIGGLGNQMFQYAAGRALSCSLGVELKLDISGFSDYDNNEFTQPRIYNLCHFNINERFADDQEVSYFREFKNNSKDRLFIFNRSISSCRYYKEKSFHVCDDFFRLQSPVYIDGYWNSEKYFSCISHVIKNEFVLKVPITQDESKIFNDITSSESVSIHFRRGDYVTNHKANKVHGVCNMSYYTQCVEYFIKKNKNYKFFIFSDDPDWVRANFKIEIPITIVESDNEIPNKDMLLMSSCRHNIIANSTFSWWAAWLNSNNEKIVCAPKKWFNLEKYNTKDLYPSGWNLF